MTKCAKIALDIKTYYAGQNQATHPNVISFTKPWNGFRYFMAYTPYPYGNGFEENPCIAASNDLIRWEKPPGLNNPIAWSEETECDELKDTHLLYRDDLDRIEIWYLGRIGSSFSEGGPLYCFRKYSYDSKNWSSYEVMYRFDTHSLASPSVIWQNGKYKFWGIQNSTDSIGLFYMESLDGYVWSHLEPCTIPEAKETDMWHGTITPLNNGFGLVWVGKKGRAANQIFYSFSVDGKKFCHPKIIIENDSKWKYLYRPALLEVDGIYYCFYGVVRLDNRWMIGMSYGLQINNLQGITISDVPYDQNLVPNTAQLMLKTSFNRVIGMIVPSLIIAEMSVLLLGLYLINNTVYIWILSDLIAITFEYLKFNRQDCLTGGIINGTISTTMALFLFSFIHDLLRLL